MRRLLRRALHALLRLPVRGRHRAADVVGRLLAPREIETVDVDGIRFPVDHSLAVYRYIYYGLYESENVAELRRVVRPGDVCIDVGANVGYLTSVMAGAVAPSGRVYAFEAAPACVRILDFLHDVPQVEVLPAAVADRSGTARFHETDVIVSLGYGYLDGFGSWPGATEHEVAAWALDDFCAERGIDRVRYLKIDVEGAEPLVLRGAERLLREQRADFVLTELSFGRDDAEAARDAEVRALLGDAGYVESRRAGRDVIWRPAGAA